MMDRSAIGRPESRDQAPEVGSFWVCFSRTTTGLVQNCRLTIQTEPTISEPFKLNPNAGTMLTRLYLRASTNDQDAGRARATLEQFGVENGLTIAATYAENESGAKLDRPALFRLLADSKPGDVLLCEQVDRLSRLTDTDWKRLRVEIDCKQVRSRPEDEKRNAGIAAMLAAGVSWSAIQNATGCGRATVAKIAARLRSAA
jgi:DNA invertase Pin-like site-specific DNA recombinase